MARPGGRQALAALAALAMLVARPAPAQELIADLSHHVIEIASDFTGTELLVFGAMEGEGDIVAVVRGPREAVTVRKKARIFGIWMNARAARFSSVPGFYGIAATRAPEEIAAIETRRLLEMGTDSLRLDPEEGLDGATVAEFRAALVAARQAEGLFPVRPGRVDTAAGRLFRARIPFPAGLPTGRYVADVYLMRDGQAVAAQSLPLSVAKAGLGAAIYDFAHRQGPLYGLLAVAAAAVAGFAASALFGRRR